MHMLKLTLTLTILCCSIYSYAQEPAKIYPKLFDYTQGRYITEELEVRKRSAPERSVNGGSSLMIYKEGDKELNELLRDRYAVVEFDTIKYVNCTLSGSYGYGDVFYETEYRFFYIDDGVPEEALISGAFSKRTIYYGLDKITGRTYSLTRSFMKELLRPHGTLWQQFKTDPYAYYPTRLKEYLHAVYEIYKK